MSLGTAKKSELITDIKELMANKNKKREIEATIDGVNKASVEDLLTITA